eukprot:gene3442-3912_t
MRIGVPHAPPRELGLPQCTDGSGNVPAGTACALPFVSGGASNYGCQGTNHSGAGWCATTPNFDHDGKWGGCTLCDQPQCTHGGTVAEFTPCVFPFIYKGSSVNVCQSGSQSWCSTTANYDKDGKWGYCDYCPSTNVHMTGSATTTSSGVQTIEVSWDGAVGPTYAPSPALCPLRGRLARERLGVPAEPPPNASDHSYITWFRASESATWQQPTVGNAQGKGTLSYTATGDAGQEYAVHYISVLHLVAQVPCTGCQVPPNVLANSLVPVFHYQHEFPSEFPPSGG